MNPMPPNKNQHRRRARFLFAGIALVVAAAAGTAWVLDWTALRPLPMSGGLWFPAKLEIPAPHFLQSDPAWGDDLLGPTQESLSQSGCAVASAAMALGARGIETDPGRLNAFLQSLPGGYTPEGWIYWEKAAETDPGSTASLLPHYEDSPSHFLIDTNLLLGNPVIARVRYENGTTHFVLINGKRGFEYLILDPGEGGKNGPTLLSSLPAPVEAIRFYKRQPH
jgi:hypothetical protein